MTAAPDAYAKGLGLSALGMLILSPDGLMLRLVRDASILQVAFYRPLFIGVSITLVLALLYRGRFPGVVRGMGRFGVASTVLLAGANLLFIAAIMTTTVANTLILFATMPLWSAILGRVLIKERVAARTWAAILIALAGVIVLFRGSLGEGAWHGDAFALGMAFLHGLNLVVVRKAGNRDMTPAVGFAGFTGAVAMLPFAATVPATGLAITGHDLLVLGVLCLVIQPLAWSLYLMGARYAPAAEIGLIGLIETVLGPLWAWLGVGEAPGAAALAGGAIVVLAVALNAALGITARARARAEAVP